MTMSSIGDNYTIHKVSTKRTRQACCPCRRKKARCPGEKPTCSLCHRLGQRCSYEAQTASHARSRSKPEPASAPAQAQDQRNEPNEIQDAPNADRLQRIEDRLETMARLLQEGLPRVAFLHETTANNRHVDQDYDARDGVDETQELSRLNDSLSPNHDETSFPGGFIEREVEIYLSYFHDQPYCVFSKIWLLENAKSLPLEISLPLVALTFHLPRRLRETMFGGPLDAMSFSEKAWNIVSNKYKEGHMNLSALQGTFLMAQADFAAGRAHRGYASVAFGLRTVQSVGLNKNRYSNSSNLQENEMRKRITWAFFMLDRTYSASRNYSLALTDKHFTLPFPSRETCPPFDEPISVFRGTLHDGPGKQGQNVDHGILACLLRLYALWGKATEYVFEPFAENSLPPWQTGSALAILESEWLQFETHFADAHRYINVDFKRRAREDPQSRTYLSTWICVQFLFHSIQCLLHHPFVIMTKLSDFNGNISTTFLQKSFETSLLHSRWIVRFIREMGEVNFEVCDPFLGYLAGIAATIQLEHTGSKNPQIALLLNKEFRVLVDFMTELSDYWGNMSILVRKVNKLAARHHNYGSLYYNQEGFSGALSKMPTPSNMPRMATSDEALMWEILDVGASSGGAPEAQFGDLAILQGHNNDFETGRRVESNSGPAGASQRSGNDQLDSVASNLPGQDIPLTDQISGSINEGPLPDWPFPGSGNDFMGAGIPDIPEWMILGDYMAEHL
ncbi:hypothetical protein N7508_010295 [Penicillium antarcticum]|uniref:uncharacterized protein n=1 Tax=Penicillium antarcticum TaxID=416450 RepID=UPI00239F80FE|nr:uncharacterized protein N7508_010295 [Penicillium antarcticum]KAJ5295474.1 hypothetical protein N7508_010295 [Penicillium antarcticum]